MLLVERLVVKAEHLQRGKNARESLFHVHFAQVLVGDLRRWQKEDDNGSSVEWTIREHKETL